MPAPGWCTLGFLKSLSGGNVRMHVYACVYAPKAINNWRCDFDIVWLVEYLLLLFISIFLEIAINVINRRGLSNKMHHQLQPKKTKVMLYYLFI